MLSTDEILPLLSQDESPTLEFKWDWYRLEDDPKEKTLQKAELVKDILSLANGSVETAGEPAVMIVGVSDEKSDDGSRAINDIGSKLPTAGEILQMVRPLSNPPLGFLEVVPHRVGKTSFFSIVIPPSPHLYETTRSLETKSRTYSEHVVFIRKGDSIAIATSREREAIKTLKAIRVTEIRNPTPLLFGGTVGATTSAILMGQFGAKKTGKAEGAIGGAVAGIMVGGLLGGLMGKMYEALAEGSERWRQPQGLKRGIVTVGAGVFVAAAWYLTNKINDVILGKADGSSVLEERPSDLL